VDSLSEAVRLDDEAPGAAARRDALRRARWERKLAEAYWRLGKLDLSLAHGREALARLGRPEPATRTSLLASFALQVLFQTLRRLRLGELARRLPKLPGALPASALQDEARAWAQMGQVYYFYNRSLHSFHTVVRALNAAESAGPESGELARAYANVGLSFSILPVAAAGRLYQRSARTMAEKVNDLPSLSYVLLIIGMTETPAARWDKAAEALEAAQRLCERLGDQSALGEVLTNLGDAAYYRGDIAAVQKHGLELCRLSSQSGHRQQQAWGNSLLGMHALQAGPIDQAVNFLEQAWNLLTLDDEQDHVSGYLNRGVVAMAYTRQGDLASAQRVTETLARLTSQPVSLAFPTFDGYAGLAEASLALWEAEGEAGKADRKQRTEQACLALEHFARLFPMARPRARLWRGKFHWLAGHRLAAWLDWRRSLGLAQKLAMPYEQGLTHYEIGRCTPGRERQKHLARAAELFEMLGARYDLERAREAQ
jgi:tetratricopeptide (TPR) repeat protein